MKKVLIFGDSFAADWTVKYDGEGWPNMLAQKHKVLNLAQAGVSEYKIHMQLDSINWLNEYDVFICCHTSPNRVPTRQHPRLSDDPLHYAADLIYSDIEYHSSKWYNIFNRSLHAAKNFFNHHYDNDYFETTYKLFRQAIQDRLYGREYIVLNTFPDMKDFIIEENVIDITDVVTKHHGLINHMSPKGNQLVYQRLMGKI
jgi:lysophospholipase L1-like esterase